MPCEWYYWRDDADWVHQSALVRWREEYAEGVDCPVPIRDVRRRVFLEHSIPPELADKSVEGLAEAGVVAVSEQQARDLIVDDYYARHGVRPDDEQIVALIRGHVPVAEEVV